MTSIQTNLIKINLVCQGSKKTNNNKKLSVNSLKNFISF
jgi:hypothetical protein